MTTTHLIHFFFGGAGPPNTPEILLQAAIIDIVGDQSDGAIVTACATPWLAILNEIERDPDFLFEFAKHPRKFEEFLAAAYGRAGYEVVLTPQSKDGLCRSGESP